MTTDAQWHANRRNANKSTGPTSREGKERSKMNSLKHGGFLSECTNISATILDENAADVQLLFDALVEDLDPQTVLELTQAQAIAQQIVNQQRVGRLSSHLASAEEIGPIDGLSPDELDQIADIWEQIIHTISFRDAPAKPDMQYDQIALAFYAANKKKIGRHPPAIDPHLTGDAAVEAWRDEVCRISNRVYEDHDDATKQILAIRQDHWRRADHLRREIAGIEARRILESLGKAIDLQDRVARGIARDVKAYRELQASRPPTHTDAEEESRNEPNPESETFPESTNTFPDELDNII